MLNNPPQFSKKLIQWYLKNKRSMPWRETTNPYHIWLSEIILQQTRVAQGLPYYLAFTTNFPTVESLAQAPEEEVLKLWQGLGYYSRARNLHHTAKVVSNELNGVFPDTYEALLKLKGVGDYTASAISSFCFDLPAAVVDGNVYRVLARYFGIETPINSTNGIKEFKALAQQLIDVKQPGLYNQAIMEFGALHCAPQNPDCGSCIFSDSCHALQQEKVTALPVKIKAAKVKKRYFNYMVVISEENQTILKQRTQKGIWLQLYEFPLIESANSLSLEQLRAASKFKDFTAEIAIDSITLYKTEAVIHKLSHQHLYTHFWIVNTAQPLKDGVPIAEIRSYAVPVLIANFISSFSGFKA